MDARDTLVLEHLWLVQRIAQKMIARMSQKIELGDLIGWGHLGLLDAAVKFRPEAGTLFKQYAAMRIYGAIFDGLRELDVIPRSVRQAQAKIEKATRQLREELDREPTYEEIRMKAGVMQDAFDNAMQMDRFAMPLSLDLPLTEEVKGLLHEAIPDPHWIHPLESMIASASKDALQIAIGQLPEREAVVIRLYYLEELPMKEIGTRLTVGESRICQIHGDALWRLRVKLRNMESAAQHPHPEVIPMASAGKNNWKAPKTMGSNTRTEGRRINALIREGVLKEPFRGAGLTAADSKTFPERDIPGQVSNLLQAGKIIADSSAGPRWYRAVMKPIERLPSAVYIALQTDRAGFFETILCALRDLALSEEEATANNGAGLQFDTSIVKDAIKGAVPTPLTDAHVMAILHEAVNGSTPFLDCESGSYHFALQAKQLLGMTNGSNGKQPQPPAPADPPLPPVPPTPTPPTPPSPLVPPALPAPMLIEEDDDDTEYNLGPAPRMRTGMRGIGEALSQTLHHYYWEYGDGLFALNAIRHARELRTTTGALTQRMRLIVEEGVVRRQERGYYLLNMPRVPEEWKQLRAAKLAELKASRHAQQAAPSINGVGATQATAPTNEVRDSSISPTDDLAPTPTSPNLPSGGVAEEDSRPAAVPTPSPTSSTLDEDERAELARVLTQLGAEVSQLRSEVREMKARQGGIERSNRELRDALNARIAQDTRYVHARFLRGQPAWVVQTFLEMLTQLVRGQSDEHGEEND